MNRNIIGALILSCALIAAPLISSADTMSDLQAQINSLLQQLHALQAQQQTSTQSTAPSDNEISGVHNQAQCPNLTTTLSVGSTDAKTNGQVSELQQFLTDNLNISDDIVTGYYGKKTAAYVKQFQAAHRLEQVGWAGKQTRAAITVTCQNSNTSSFSTTGSTTGTILAGRSCPIYSRLPCAAGSHFEKSAGVDATGCPLPQKCVPDTCPATICASGYHLETSAAVDANSCPLPGKCVPDKMACPAIATSCPAGWHDFVETDCSHTCRADKSCPMYALTECAGHWENSIDANGCSIPKCVPKTPVPAERTAFTWSYVGPVTAKHCTKMNEGSDAAYWQDNYLCTDADIGMKWSSYGTISGMTCKMIYDTALVTDLRDPWADNYLCLPSDSPYTFTWSNNGPVTGKQCTKINEPSAAPAWQNTYPEPIAK